MNPRIHDRKLWHGIPGDYSPNLEPCGRPIKNPAVLRKLAIDRAIEERDTTHPRFRCPECLHVFPLDYGRSSRTPNHPFKEYEIHCVDCVRDLRLEKEAKRLRR